MVQTMNEYGKLLSHVADKYSIKRGNKEPEGQWEARIIYSLTGQMGLASLWDQIEEGTTSIVHMKDRMQTIFEAYQEMYRHISALKGEPRSVVDEIYELYLKNGVIYHEPNRVLMSAMVEGNAGGIALTRGYPLDEEQCMSGLGTYLLKNQGARSAEDIFPIGWDSLTEIWKKTVEEASWSPIYTESPIEYLRMTPPFTSGYWVKRPDESGRVSLLRVMLKDSRIYYLYRQKGDTLEGSQIPGWRVDHYEYRALSTGCLKYNNLLPPIRVKETGETVTVSFGYLPSLSELSLWKLYSWPTSIQSIPSNFTRICTKPVFDAFEEMFSKKGYFFEKEL